MTESDNTVMKKHVMLGAAALATMIAAQAQAATVFESFPNYAVAGPTPQNNCSSCGGYGALFASFSLSSAQTLNKAFVLVSNIGNEHAAMTVSIFHDGGNDLIALNPDGSISSPFLSIGYTAPSSFVAEPGDNSLVEFALPDWQLAAGKYWVRFAGYENVLPLYTTATPGHSRAIGTDLLIEGRNVTFNPANQAVGFSFNAVDINPVGGIPEPGTWALTIVGMGMIGGAMRRTRRTAAAI